MKETESNFVRHLFDVFAIPNTDDFTYTTKV